MRAEDDESVAVSVSGEHAIATRRRFLCCCVYALRGRPVTRHKWHRLVLETGLVFIIDVSTGEHRRTCSLK